MTNNKISNGPAGAAAYASDLTVISTLGMEDVKISVGSAALGPGLFSEAEPFHRKYQKLITCALGILVCHFILGLLQENMVIYLTVLIAFAVGAWVKDVLRKLTKGQYGEGEKKEKFTYTMSLVFVQCIINSLFAFGAMTFFTRETDKTPKSLYSMCSMTYLGAMLASNQALQYISYPTQVLGKSAKPIPVMILGILLARKRYPYAKFLFIFMICMGMAMVLFKDQKPSGSTEEHKMGWGEIFLLVSLTLDGLTGAMQDRMRSDHKTGPYHMMLNMNMWSLIWLAGGLIVSGEGVLFLGFIQRYPSLIIKMVTFGLASAIGQVFIFITVTSFGPLSCSIITTTRKMFTILGSVIIFQNPMSSRQWLGTALVFLGIGLDSVYGKEKKDAKASR